MTPIITFDFESHPIGPRPDHYPPQPVGLAVRWPDGEGRYWSFGHPGGNKCSEEEARGELARAVDSGLPMLAHSAKFDLSIANERWGLRVPKWDRLHDTMFLAFLVDPYAKTLGLKQLAEVWLGMPPEERSVVDEWVLDHKATLPTFDWLNDGKQPTKKSAGAWIGYAPAEIVGPYAWGDVDRTWRLFQTLYPLVQQAGMGDAYDVERQLLPILMENERVGLRVDHARLGEDVETYQRAFNYAEDWLRWRLDAAGLNFDADRDVAAILDERGIVTEWSETESGQRSVSKKNLHPDAFGDAEVASALGYRNRLKTCLKMFMEPWLAQADRRGGWISTEWNQVASPNGGTRTGRPSTRNPNFLNISKAFGGADGYVHPAHLEGLPELPLVRRYILPDEGHVILKRDFNGQELRVFGHYEHGDLQRRYVADPSLDVHDYVGENIAALTGKRLPRMNVKILNFQAIYGGGVPAAQAALRVSYDEAKQFKDFHDRALPGRKVLSDTLTSVLRSGMAVRTYGGRLYVREPLKWDAKRQRWSDHDYAMLNYLVQGSAADITKRAMIALVNHADWHSRFMLQVYDELDISAPEGEAVKQMRVLREAMESIPLRVLLMSDGESGLNWGEMKEWSDTIHGR